MHDINTETNALDRCIHGAPSPCSNDCPFDFDVRSFINKIKRGSTNSAYNSYRDAVVFPDIAYLLCKAPCMNICSEKIEASDKCPVNILKLEQSVFENAKNKEPVNYSVTKQNKKIIILSSALSNLTCALKLAQGGYDVSVFEAENKLCSSLEQHLDREIFEEAILKQFKYAKCEFNFEVKTENISFEDYDAVVVSSKGLLNVDYNAENVFYINENAEPFMQIQQGKALAKKIDWFLKTGNKQESEEIFPGEYTNDGVDFKNNLESNILSADFYTKEEAASEASRCTGCDCRKCMDECIMLREYGMTIPHLSRSVGLSVNLQEHAQAREGMRQIGGCNSCGLCKNICPENIDIGEVLLNAREELFTQGILPKAHHEFWMRDLAFSDSYEAAVFYMPDKESCTYMFFPGCQAGGSDIRYVSKTYEYLLNEQPDSALLLYCCANPLLWAGDKEAMYAEHDKIKQYWQEAGKPVLLTICPSCHKMFKDYMPEIPVKMIYEVLDIKESKNNAHPSKATVFDPCSSRDYPDMQNSIREISRSLGVELEELNYSGANSQCCSWGGQTHIVNPGVLNMQAGEQIAQSELPYITYCSNCTDIFLARGKDTHHILDLILNINGENRKAPSLTQKRSNRRALKKELVEKYNINERFSEYAPPIKLIIDEKLTKKLDAELILEDDICLVVQNSEKNKSYILNNENSHRISHLKIGLFTFWVEYSINDDEETYFIHNAYSHRMNLKGE